MNFVEAVFSSSHPHLNGGLAAASLQDFTPAWPVLKGRHAARDSSAGAGGGLPVGKEAIHTLIQQRRNSFTEAELILRSSTPRTTKL